MKLFSVRKRRMIKLGYDLGLTFLPRAIPYSSPSPQEIECQEAFSTLSRSNGLPAQVDDWWDMRSEPGRGMNHLRFKSISEFSKMHPWVTEVSREGSIKLFLLSSEFLSPATLLLEILSRHYGFKLTNYEISVWYRTYYSVYKNLKEMVVIQRQNRNLAPLPLQFFFKFFIDVPGFKTLVNHTSHVHIIPTPYLSLESLVCSTRIPEPLRVTLLLC